MPGRAALLPGLPRICSCPQKSAALAGGTCSSVLCTPERQGRLLAMGLPPHTPSLEKWVWQSASVFVCCVLIARRGKKTVCVFFMPALGAAELDIAACKAPAQFALQGRGKEREELCSLSATLGRRGTPRRCVRLALPRICCPPSAAPLPALKSYLPNFAAGNFRQAPSPRA